MDVLKATLGKIREILKKIQGCAMATRVRRSAFYDFICSNYHILQ
jgi:hypothetical protein